MNKRRIKRIEHAGSNLRGNLLVNVVWVIDVPNQASLTHELIPITETEPLAFTSQAALEIWTRQNA